MLMIKQVKKLKIIEGSKFTWKRSLYRNRSINENIDLFQNEKKWRF